ncbi:DEKNAAC102194 [Brettanomyces naardenensis]|uniref:Phosphotransferase n=1 Tax=Brettanomyces naardenensis TaxID=13370 RepID=A0A448YJX4_BRENA|nr:DEKNAAC102194 [Brettanomyces naardenensis]
MVSPKLQKRVNQILKSFEVSQDLILRGVDHFIDMATKGLETKDDPEALLMIPTYVTSIPSGEEKGVLLAADLGGTNFRVVSVTLNGDHTFSLVQSKSPIPIDLMTGTSAELFHWLAEKVQKFVETHHGDSIETGGKFKLGFTFSFPVDQTSLDSGTLDRWTKGFDVRDAIGQDIVALFQQHLDALKVPVKVSALANDTVGTLLARSYTGANKEGETVIGCIFGTGTNGAYAEKLDNIKKIPESVRNELKANGVTEMVINTEWGSFDNQLQILPKTKWDEEVDKNSANPGFHMFEKRVSGMFLGEILRQVLLDLYREGLILKPYAKEDDLPHRLRTPWTLSSEAMSLFEIDDSTGLKASELKLQQMLRLPTNSDERLVIQQLTRAIAHRSAYLAAIPISAILIKVGAFDGHHVEVDVGADGSVVEFYPGYRTMMRDAIALTQLGPKGERRLHINISKDGSSVGAALCALSEQDEE